MPTQMETSFHSLFSSPSLLPPLSMGNVCFFFSNKIHVPMYQVWSYNTNNIGYNTMYIQLLLQQHKGAGKFPQEVKVSLEPQ